MPDDVKTVTLYDRDFFEWGMAQARALRAVCDAIQHTAPQNSSFAGCSTGVGLGKSCRGDRRIGPQGSAELTSRITTIIEHLAKLQHSPARPRAGWTETAGRARSEIDDIVRDSPSLHREVAEVIARKADGAVKLAANSLVAYGELTRGGEKPGSLR